MNFCTEGMWTHVLSSCHQKKQGIYFENYVYFGTRVWEGKTPAPLIQMILLSCVPPTRCSSGFVLISPHTRKKIYILSYIVCFHGITVWTVISVKT